MPKVMPQTAESVSPSHPDKMCDRISDAILDECLHQDPNSRVAVETMGGHGEIKVTGEVTTHADVDIEKIIKRIAGEDFIIQVNIKAQSPEIANGVDDGGAGDQGIMVGYACDDNEAMIPDEQFLARQICKRLYNKFPFDGKTQVTMEAGKIKTVVASFQNIGMQTIEQEVIDWLREKCDTNEEIMAMEEVQILANPAGNWEIGGFEADTGLTGRKLMVDNYGPQIPIGGGAFSGKDSTKVDRSAAYMARKIAVDFLKTAQKRGDKSIQVWVKLAYAIGVAEPVMATAEVEYAHAQGRFKELHDLFSDKAKYSYDLTPAGIIKLLDLKKSQFEETAVWGHFGREFNWEK